MTDEDSGPHPYNCDCIWCTPPIADDQRQVWCAKCEHWEEDCRCPSPDDPPKQGINDGEIAGEWEAIAAQIDYWRDKDLAYWQWRREQAYQSFLDRQLNKGRMLQWKRK